MIQKFSIHNGVVIPIDRDNIDTDAILPKQFMKSIRRTGFGDNLFDEWRYLDRGEPGADCSRRPKNSAFVLNQPRYIGGSILLARSNFGCGSSREHAPWALRDFGIRVIIASSFADIFFGNCLKSGILPVKLPIATIDSLFRVVDQIEGYRLTADLVREQITTPDGHIYPFHLDASRRHLLIEGLDEIAVTLLDESRIEAYEARRRMTEPWLFEADSVAQVSESRAGA